MKKSPTTASKKAAAQSLPPFAGASTAWVISDGTKGMEVQSLSLAERMGLDVRVIRLSPPWLLRHAPRLARWPFLPLPRKIAAIDEDWPDVIITTGRRMAGLSILLRRHSHAHRRGRPPSKTIHIQNPKLPPSFFDWMVVPSHDNLRADNILVSIGSLSPLTKAKVAKAKSAVPDIVTAMPKPLIVVMVGGSNRRYRVHWQDYYALGAYAVALAESTEASLAFVPSPRSLDDAPDAIRTAIDNARFNPAFWIWDGAGENPYPGILGFATAIVVTSDSVNMTSEACFCGKPVYSYFFHEESGRIALFHRIMQKGGYTRDINDLSPYTFATQSTPSLDETGRISALLRGKTSK